ncbi:MAG: oxygenase MpaB family protein [Chloroflexota bacterium]
MAAEALPEPHPPLPERSADSIAWKINSEIVLLLGWNPAVLLQVAHPLVAAGVTDHSLFLTDPAGRTKRFRRTLNAMFDLTFGLPAEVQRAADGINAIHDRVHGRLRQAAGPYTAGHSYSAHDPELLRWVHCTMLEVFPRTYRLYVGTLTDAEWDRYCAEASRVEPLLGVPEGFLPSSLPELRAYMREMLASGQIAVSEESRVLAAEILHPILPPALMPLSPFFRLPMVGLLPPSVRAAYGFAWDARREHLLQDSARLVRPLLALTPSLLRHWPAARRAFARARRGELEPPAPVRRPAAS